MPNRYIKTGQYIQCKACGKEVYAAPWEIKRRKGKMFCSKTCTYRGRECTMLFQKGHPKSFLGKRIHTQETRLKISRSQLGKMRKNPNDLITPFDRRERLRFRNTMQKLIFIRDEYICQICFSEKSGNLSVDHIKSWAKFPELRFIASNCRTLCMACHYYVTFKRKIPEGLIWGHNLCKAGRRVAI